MNHESAEQRRTQLEIITELYKLTCEMEKRLTNADFLVLSVEKRQALIAEFEKSKTETAREPADPETMAEMKRLVKEIISKDTSITKALEEHRNAAKRDLTIIQQTRAGYLNQQNLQAGRKMDYKE
jgi:hypothetical protein